MTDAPPAGVVVDTMVVSWFFDDRGNPLGDRYRELVGIRPAVLAFQTVMELRVEPDGASFVDDASSVGSPTWPLCSPTTRGSPSAPISWPDAGRSVTPSATRSIPGTVDRSRRCPPRRAARLARRRLPWRPRSRTDHRRFGPLILCRGTSRLRRDEDGSRARGAGASSMNSTAASNVQVLGAATRCQRKWPPTSDERGDSTADLVNPLSIHGAVPGGIDRYSMDTTPRLTCQYSRGCVETNSLYHASKEVVVGWNPSTPTRTGSSERV